MKNILFLVSLVGLILSEISFAGHSEAVKYMGQKPIINTELIPKSSSSTLKASLKDSLNDKENNAVARSKAGISTRNISSSSPVVKNVVKHKKSLSSANKKRFLSLELGKVLHLGENSWEGNEATSFDDLFAEVSYKYGEWVNWGDLLFSFSYASQSINGNKARKLGIMPMISFPDAESRFPLYFGLGVGPGIYMKKIQNQSSVSVDYNLFAGLRLYNLFKESGLQLELGIKNQMMLFSNGKFNEGFYVSTGMVFKF